MEYLNIITPICSAIVTILTLWGLLSKKFDKIDGSFDKIHEELKEIRHDIRETDSRVSRIEGYLLGLDRPKTGTEK